MPRPSRRQRSTADDARRTTRSQRARSPVSSDNESDTYSDEKPVTRRRGRRVSTPRYESTPVEDEDEEEEKPARRRGRRVATPREEGTPMDEDEDNEDVQQDYHVENDAFVLDEDEAGEKKIDPDGYLLGGRSFHIPTMLLPERSDRRLYMLSIDVARGLGYRDSGYFFRKNPLIHKVLLTMDEKDQLIAEGRISSGLRSRNVTAVTARAVFQVIGARSIARGRNVTDDYYEAQARAEGKKEGTLAMQPSTQDLMSRRGDRRRDYDRERRHGSDAATYTTVDPHGHVVTTTFGDAGHAPFDRTSHLTQRRNMLMRADMSEENWMAMYAQSVRAANAELLAARRDRLVALPSSHKPSALDEHVLCDTRPPWEREQAPSTDAMRRHARRERAPPLGLYDPHTHTAHVPFHTQPTAAWFAKVDDEPRIPVPSARLARIYTTETCIMMGS